MLFVTFHGYSPSSKTKATSKQSGKNNIYAYDETATPVKKYKNVLQNAQGLAELRGMLYANGLLYVASGAKKASGVYCFTPAAFPNFGNQQTFITSKVPAISHPFSFTYQSLAGGQTQRWYITNQDTNVVATLIAGSPYYGSAVASPTCANNALYLHALLQDLAAQPNPPVLEFLDGTFVASASAGSPLPDTTPVDPSWGGLSASIPSGKVQNSVRDVTLYNGVLYVADEAGNAVRMYDPVLGVPWGSTGSYVNGSSTVPLSSPVHLLVYKNNLYVSSGSVVSYGPCPAPPSAPPALPGAFSSSQFPIPPYPTPPSGYTGSVTLSLELFTTLPDTVSGMAFDNHGNFYAALRKKKEIYQLPFGSTAPQLLTSVPDSPEFLLWLPSGGPS